MDYIVDQSCLLDKLEAQKLKMKASKYCMFGRHLYKRSFSGPLLKCLKLK